MFGASALPTEPPPLPERANFIILTSSFPVSNYSVTKRPSLFLSVGSRQIENSPKLSSDADVAHHRPPKQVPAKIVGNISTGVPAKSCVGIFYLMKIFFLHLHVFLWQQLAFRKNDWRRSSHYQNCSFFLLERNNERNHKFFATQKIVTAVTFSVRSVVTFSGCTFWLLTYDSDGFSLNLWGEAV